MPSVPGDEAPVVVNMPLTQLRTDGGTEPRCRIDDATVQEYQDALEADVCFPPVVAFHDGTDYWLADGYHRLEAHCGANRTTISVQIRPGSRRDAVLYAVGANASHGLRRSDDDKRRAVNMLLTDAEWGTWSNREIARRCLVSPSFVEKVRESLSAVDSEPQSATSERPDGTAPAAVDDDSSTRPRTYRTRHGTNATMKTGRIGRKKTTHREQAVESQPEAAGEEPTPQAPVELDTSTSAGLADTPTVVSETEEQPAPARAQGQRNLSARTTLERLADRLGQAEKNARRGMRLPEEEREAALAELLATITDLPARARQGRL
jgi:hypothetical protein